MSHAELLTEFENRLKSVGIEIFDVKSLHVTEDDFEHGKCGFLAGNLFLTIPDQKS